VSDFLKTKRDEIAARLTELQPLVEEYRQLEAASAALAGLPGAATRTTTTRTTARRPRAAATRTTRSRRSSTTTGRRGRPRGSGTRAIQTLELVKSKPGITIPEIASAMGIKQNYLYRVLPGLEKDGKVVKRDRGWHAAA
jgi:hypothetical protein